MCLDEVLALVLIVRDGLGLEFSELRRVKRFASPKRAEKGTPVTRYLGAMTYLLLALSLMGLLLTP